MNKTKTMMISRCFTIMLMTAFLGMVPSLASATILGVTSTSASPTFNLTAKADTISTSDGDSMWMWGYARHNGANSNGATDLIMQFPGPTFIVNQGANVTINLYNRLPVPVSIVFPGQTLTSVTGGTAGLLTNEVAASNATGTIRRGPVTYRFTASQPGTYIYYSGTRPDLQVEMGLAGTIIVRPTGFAAMNPKRAYGDPSTAYDREHLFFLSEADPVIHQQVAFASGTLAQIQARIAAIDMTKRHAVDWFINGRNFPDTVADPGVGWLPTQPYNCLPLAYPRDEVLMRIVGAGTDFHPYHTHGQNHLVIARDGRLLKTAASASPDLAVSDFTTTTVPGETLDAIWGPWTGANLGWDIYGTADINPHTCIPDATGFDPATREYCADHYKPIPVTLPTQSELTIGVVGQGMWGGTPYLGIPASVPPNVSEQNPMAGYPFMWHSHSERELTTNNLFPGGMATMMMVVPVGTPIP